jgi:tetratricopeptide (TPR) repeat protein
MIRFARFAPIAAAALLAAAAQISFAADSATPAVPVPYDPLAGARSLIAENKWVAAIDELKRVNMPRSADWNNLMGYSHRKARTPDLAAAERYYDAALKIDPRHRGALEYSGELFLQLGDLARAEQRLAALAQSCGNCEEKKDLEAAIASFKSNPNAIAAKQ